MFINPCNRGKEENLMGHYLPSKMDMTMIKMSSKIPLLYLNELKDQLLGDGLGEYVVDAKIMHQCINASKCSKQRSCGEAL